MFQDFLIGSVVSLVIMFTHLLGTILIVFGVERMRKSSILSGISYVATLLGFVYIVLSIMLFSGTAIWATLYFYIGLTVNWGDAFYSSLVNYTTLGAGDLVLSSSTRIYGPMSAASGILMFSWAAAVLVYILQANLSAMIAFTKDGTPEEAPKHQCPDCAQWIAKGR